ncbi:hypothetical protein G5C60_42815 [Streptomyces sp. HC44]|uniref:Uncharacterized protein n=1 Tax=Streptomyces scabichelini TaxID=2711217 RepID=A0A6G4VK54_9ACTN|nr:hypothetical protein [Streptomyces scabichelini]
MTGRRRWRWVAVVWAVAVVVGGGLTLWLQDSTEASAPSTREQQGVPAPLLSVSEEELRSMCPEAYDDDRDGAMLCFVRKKGG